jgi:hypothetical protein
MFDKLTSRSCIFEVIRRCLSRCSAARALRVRYEWVLSFFMSAYVVFSN